MHRPSPDPLPAAVQRGSFAMVASSAQDGPQRCGRAERADGRRAGQCRVGCRDQSRPVAEEHDQHPEPCCYLPERVGRPCALGGQLAVAVLAPSCGAGEPWRPGPAVAGAGSPAAPHQGAVSQRLRAAQRQGPDSSRGSPRGSDGAEEHLEDCAVLGLRLVLRRGDGLGRGREAGKCCQSGHRRGPGAQRRAARVCGRGPSALVVGLCELEGAELRGRAELCGHSRLCSSVPRPRGPRRAVPGSLRGGRRDGPRDRFKVELPSCRCVLPGACEDLLPAPPVHRVIWAKSVPRRGASDPRKRSPGSGRAARPRVFLDWQPKQLCSRAAARGAGPWQLLHPQAGSGGPGRAAEASADRPSNRGNIHQRPLAVHGL
mmetsp:Transcript_6777/g.16341  ORF Transcript_6777/g.16341 Transcript_6777/m.16341 type:complete len:373 (+) Transcript_6777:2200-3318(+)